VAEHRNGLLDELVGRAVTVARLKPPDFTEEHFEEFRADPPYTTYGPVRAIRTAYVLVSYDASASYCGTLTMTRRTSCHGAP
jgi:hypothetical protein